MALTAQQQYARQRFELRYGFQIAAARNEMQTAANDIWWQGGCYERYQRDWYGATYALDISERDDVATAERLEFEAVQERAVQEYRKW